MILDPARVQQKIAELVTSRNHWQKITLGLFIFILAFVTFFYHTYQNVDQKLKELKEEQKRQTAILKKLLKEKNQNEKKSLTKYK